MRYLSLGQDMSSDVNVNGNSFRVEGMFMNNDVLDSNCYETVQVRRCELGVWQEMKDDVLVEVPVSLIYNGYPHVVIMCTPSDIVDFVYGFSWTEGIVTAIQDILSVDVRVKALGIEVHIEVVAMCAKRIEMRKRQMTARTGCGICGLDSLSDVIRDQKVINYELHISDGAIDRALESSGVLQQMNQRTGGAHAAFFVAMDGEVLLTREDVGRHVALDKLVGSMLQQELSPKEGFILTTSRASFEMVQKAVAAGVALLVTMSAPTSMAVKLADKMNIKLVAFARRGKFNVYQG